MRAKDNLGPAGVIRVAGHPVQHRSLPIPGRVGLKPQPDPERSRWENRGAVLPAQRKIRAGPE